MTERNYDIEEVVMPDKAITIPIGAIVPLANGKGYYFAPMIAGKAGKPLRQALTALREFTVLQGNEDLEAIDAALTALVKVSMGFNYMQETIDTLIDAGAVTYDLIAPLMMVVMGNEFPTPFEIKKKGTADPATDKGSQ